MAAITLQIALQGKSTLETLLKTSQYKQTQKTPFLIQFLTHFIIHFQQIHELNTENPRKVVTESNS